MLASRYEAMTDEQKALVTNYKKIAEYQKIVKANADKQAKIDKGIKLADNFPGYSGKWGDFGAHVNSYQGMIETAIRQDAKLHEIFYCENGPNYLQMNASRFSKNTDAFTIHYYLLPNRQVLREKSEKRRVNSEKVKTTSFNRNLSFFVNGLQKRFFGSFAYEFELSHFLVKYLPYGKCEIIHYVNYEIFC